MKTYNLNNRISKQARQELGRIINTHESHKSTYFWNPNSSADGRRRAERKFKENNPDVAFLWRGSKITVSMSYEETAGNVYYSLTVIEDKYWKDPSTSNPEIKDIRLIKNILKKDHKMKTHLTIKQKREQSGLTQSEIADKLNMSLSGYQKYESGVHDIRAEKFIEIINILDFSRSERIELLTIQAAYHDANAEESQKRLDKLNNIEP